MKLLPLTYFGSIAYYSAIVKNDCAFSVEELFVKQTLRNRTVIVTSQGAKNLTVPVIRPFGKNTKMEDVVISYAEDWQKNHWKSIESAYSSAPYFEFFEKDVETFYQTKYKTLVDLNYASQQMLLGWFEEKVPQIQEGSIELNETLLTDKKQVSDKKYWQVFQDKIGFTETSSILDIIFCEGNVGFQSL